MSYLLIKCIRCLIQLVINFNYEHSNILITSQKTNKLSGLRQNYSVTSLIARPIINSVQISAFHLHRSTSENYIKVCFAECFKNIQISHPLDNQIQVQLFLNEINNCPSQFEPTTLSTATVVRIVHFIEVTIIQTSTSKELTSTLDLQYLTGTLHPY